MPLKRPCWRGQGTARPGPICSGNGSTRSTSCDRRKASCSTWIQARARRTARRRAAPYNGHFGCTCYHPLFAFNQLGDLGRCALGRSDSATSASFSSLVQRHRGSGCVRISAIGSVVILSAVVMCFKRLPGPDPRPLSRPRNRARRPPFHAYPEYGGRGTNSTGCRPDVRSWQYFESFLLSVTTDSAMRIIRNCMRLSWRSGTGAS